MSRGISNRKIRFNRNNPTSPLNFHGDSINKHKLGAQIQARQPKMDLIIPYTTFLNPTTIDTECVRLSPQTDEKTACTRIDARDPGPA